MGGESGRPNGPASSMMEVGRVGILSLLPGPGFLTPDDDDEDKPEPFRDIRLFLYRELALLVFW